MDDSSILGPEEMSKNGQKDKSSASNTTAQSGAGEESLKVLIYNYNLAEKCYELGKQVIKKLLPKEIESILTQTEFSDIEEDFPLKIISDKFICVRISRERFKWGPNYRKIIWTEGETDELSRFLKGNTKKKRPFWNFVVAKLFEYFVFYVFYEICLVWNIVIISLWIYFIQLEIQPLSQLLIVNIILIILTILTIIILSFKVIVGKNSIEVKYSIPFTNLISQYDISILTLAVVQAAYPLLNLYFKYSFGAIISMVDICSSIILFSVVLVVSLIIIQREYSQHIKTKGKLLEFLYEKLTTCEKNRIPEYLNYMTFIEQTEFKKLGLATTIFVVITFIFTIGPLLLPP